MNAKRVFPILTVAAACAAGAVPVASAKAADVQQASSGNWSGYVVDSSAADRTFKTVTGSWVQPAAKCSAEPGGTYSAFWVGLGGATGREALEQDGTEVNCSASGKPTYYAWYELVPKAPVKVDVAVHPGDHMTATTSVNGHDVTETIVNHTTGATFAKTLYMSDPDLSSAEWITEAPSQCEGSVDNCSALSLSDFGKVAFSDASATDSTGHSGTIDDSDWQTARLTLSPGADSGAGADGTIGYGEPSNTTSAGATASTLTDGGSAFSVSYTQGSSSTSTGSGYGYGSGAGNGYGSGGGYGSAGGTGDGYGDGGGYGYGYGYGQGANTDGEGSGYGAYGDGTSADGGYVIVYAY
jgi:hypothetical protein